MKYVRLTAAVLICVIAPVTTAESPIRIDSIEELDKIGSDPAYPMNGSYVLTTDLDASAKTTVNGFFPIGGDTQLFTGTFDGQGHVIRNLTVRGDIYAGLFGCVGDEGIIQNLGLVNVSVRGHKAGGLTGASSGTLLRCYAYGEFMSEGHDCAAGGLIGVNRGTIHQSWAAGEVGAFYSSDDISEDGQSAGGLAGRNGVDAEITQSFAIIEVTSPQLNNNSWIGGLAGVNYGLIASCYAIGKVAGLYSGGLVGLNNERDENGDILGEGRLHHCYALCGIENTPYLDTVGGLTGQSNKGVIQKCFWNRDIAGQTGSFGKDKGLPRTEMLKRSSYARWNFREEWDIDEGRSCPWLRWQKTAEEVPPGQEVSRGDSKHQCSHITLP